MSARPYCSLARDSNGEAVALVVGEAEVPVIRESHSRRRLLPNRRRNHRLLSVLNIARMSFSRRQLCSSEVVTMRPRVLAGRTITSHPYDTYPACSPTAYIEGHVPSRGRPRAVCFDRAARSESQPRYRRGTEGTCRSGGTPPSTIVGCRLRLSDLLLWLAG